MGLAQKYKTAEVEPRLAANWHAEGIYRFSPDDPRPVFSVDTPPPTVSGNLHLGHVYSYSHTDFIVRFWRMNGYNVFYPMGFDDNGLPTERLVEKRLKIRATEVGREAFIEKCLAVSEEAEREYEALWRRLGLSIDWRYTYRTIDTLARRTSQASFLALYREGRAYRRQAPAIWCPECRTAIAQAELNDLERESRFVTLAFTRADGSALPIATTRPELLPACVAVFVHPDDARYHALAGQQATVPLFGQAVPILTDAHADPEKGTGAVMCCTFGDTTDVEWWYTYRLPLIAAVDREGRMTSAAGPLAGLRVDEARRQVIAQLEAAGLVLGVQALPQSVRVHERCDTPVEYIEAPQWFVRVLDSKPALLAQGDNVAWHPDHMHARYQHWVENLGWDWCVSRQRYFGVPFPVWYCRACGATVTAREDQLPVDPTTSSPQRPCPDCGGTDFMPEPDVMDTWATSSLSPQIVGQWLADPSLYARVFPFSLRPQAHEIIRTWAFYTIVKSHYHFAQAPWAHVMISGWGLAPEGAGKISKSRGNGPASPMEMITRYSADALRYWAASGGLGRDQIISEDKIAAGNRLVTKLWNVARFAERFVVDYLSPAERPALTPADRWLLSRLNRLVERVTVQYRAFDYASAKGDTEQFFWVDLADNYLEMVKLRLYNQEAAPDPGARYTLYRALLTVLKLFAPLLPFVTEEVYQGLFRTQEGARSLHVAAWPAAEPALIDPDAERTGEVLVAIATAVRRYKSERNLALATGVQALTLATPDAALAGQLRAAARDLMGVTRAAEIRLDGSAGGEFIGNHAGVEITIVA